MNADNQGRNVIRDIERGSHCIKDEAKKIDMCNYWGSGEPSSSHETCTELFGGDQSSSNNGRMNDVTCAKDRSYCALKSINELKLFSKM